VMDYVLVSVRHSDSSKTTWYARQSAAACYSCTQLNCRLCCSLNVLGASRAPPVTTGKYPKKVHL